MACAKPVVKIYLLPPQSEEAMRSFHEGLTATLVGVDGFGVKSEADYFAIFPSDMMSYGLGSDIHAEIDFPRRVGLLRYAQSDVVRAVGKYLQSAFPGAFVQVQPYSFEQLEGWRSGE